jgi:hypothetical protein
MLHVDRLTELLQSLRLALFPHSPRETTGCRLQARREPGIISDSLSDSITGHASPTVAGRYLHPTVEDMAAALRKFPRFSV